MQQPVLVVDFGAQYAQLIARRVREAHVYSEIVPSTMSAQDMLAKDPEAIILSGGPSSVYAEDAPHIDEDVYSSGVPILGICYGFQAMAQSLGGTVTKTGSSEYGGTELRVRVYPDSVQIDSHDPALTADELTCGQHFWEQTWRAANDEERNKAAWR
jgi:GMP synthase (glutamine-hydrolysing)